VKGRKEMLFDVAAEEAAAVGSKYRDICQCRDDLYDFMDANEWFGLKVYGHGLDTRVKGLPAVLDRLRLWLRAYQRPDAEKLELLLSAFMQKYPVLCREFSEFTDVTGHRDEGRSWQALDYLLSSASADLCWWDDEERLRLIREASGFCTATAVRLMAEFFGWIDLKNGNEKWDYLIPRRKPDIDTDTAYDAEAFCRMAYQVFNEQAWTVNGMVKKACGSRKNAGLWMFISLHFICGLRSTDMERLPSPVLPCGGEQVRERILAGEFPDSEAARIASDWQYRLDAVSMVPNKTKRYGGSPDLNVSVPTSLLVPMGIILAISASFKNGDTVFLWTEGDFLSERRFFGEDFVQAAGNRRFSTRRANKSYIQGIEFIVDFQNGPGKMKGYMAAALARSHKASYGRLPSVTDIYLRDASFTGYKPEFILREMFERGIFGFIPVLLLEQYCGEEFRRLGVHLQTRLIVGIGLTPVQLEGIAETVSRALIRSESCVRDILLSIGDGREEVGKILQSIAGGSPQAKQDGYLCLRNAAGLHCPFPERSGCVGCGYEIYTKAAVHLLMKEYVRITRMRRSNTPDAQRLGKILEEAVLPSVWETVASIQGLYPDWDNCDILDIIERGIRDAGGD